MILNYYKNTKQRNFTKALALNSSRFRYKTSRRQWMASRLGMYQTVLHQRLPLLTKRLVMVNLVARIKRHALPDEELKEQLEKILNNRKYKVFYEEIVKETVASQPETILAWLDISKYYLRNQYFLGLYLALLDKYNRPKAIATLPDLIKLSSDQQQPNSICLYSNILHTGLEERLELLNILLTQYSLTKVHLKNLSLGFNINNFVSKSRCIKAHIDTKVKVSIIVTAYNAESTLKGCVESLLNQTWHNIEVIIVNDASTDSTLRIAQQLKESDSRVELIDLSKNVGTFAAKSIAALYVQGDFLTCQDSDDWAHPSKIQDQVTPLIDNTDVIATTSYWLRMNEEGVYHSRHFYPFLRQNPASPMFRFEQVKEDIGLWHIVRTGADSEFFERLKLYYGKDKIKVVKKPLTIASHRENSLMTSQEYGAYNRTSMLNRLDYWEAWRKWHIDCLYNRLPLKVPTIHEQASRGEDTFKDIPIAIKVDSKDIKTSLFNHKK